MDALLGSARIHTLLGEPEAARRDLERASERLQGPGRAAALVAWANLLDPEAEAERREELHQRALADDPRNEEALEALSKAAADRGEWEFFDDLCERRFSLAIGAIRRLAVAHDTARSLLGPGRNPRGARHWLERALELFPGDPVVHFQLADCEGLAGNPGAREPHLRMGWELAGNATPLDVLRECAELSAERGDFDQAASDLSTLIELEGPRRRPSPSSGAFSNRPGATTTSSRCWCRWPATSRAPRPPTCGCGWPTCSRRAATPTPRRTPSRRRCSRRPGMHPPSTSSSSSCARTNATTSWPYASKRPGRPRPWTTTPGWAGACGWRSSKASSSEMPRRPTATYELILAQRPDEPGARQGLERMALASGDSDAIVQTFAHELEVCRDPERARFLAFELVRLHEREDRPEEALAALALLAERIPEDREALEARARIEEASGQSEALVRTLTRLDAFVGGTDQASLRRRLAALHADCGDAAQAMEAFRAALEAEPGDVESLAALETLLAEAGEHGELAEVRARLARQLPPEERAACRTRLGALLEDELGDLPAAIAALEQALDDPAPPPETSQRLERLLEQTGRDEDLALRLEGTARRVGRRRARSPPGRSQASRPAARPTRPSWRSRRPLRRFGAHTTPKTKTSRPPTSARCVARDATSTWRPCSAAAPSERTTPTSVRVSTSSAPSS